MERGRGNRERDKSEKAEGDIERERATEPGRGRGRGKRERGTRHLPPLGVGSAPTFKKKNGPVNNPTLNGCASRTLFLHGDFALDFAESLGVAHHRVADGGHLGLAAPFEKGQGLRRQIRVPSVCVCVQGEREYLESDRTCVGTGERENVCDYSGLAALFENLPSVCTCI